MEYRQLGRSGLRVSVLTLGHHDLRRPRAGSSAVGIDRPRRRQTPDRTCALDAGVNLIDTADVYSDGVVRGDSRRGHSGPPRRRARRQQGRGCRWATARTTPDSRDITSSAAARPRCDGYGTDYLDLYQVHEWDGQTPLEETLDALDSLVRSGKVRYVGASNYTAWQLMKALGISERRGLARFVSQQIYYSLQARDAEYELVPLDPGPGPRHSDLEPARRWAAIRQVPARSAGAGGQPTSRRLERAPDPRRGQALRHDRGAGGDRRRPRRVRGPGRAGLPAAQARRHLGRSSARAPTSSWPTIWRPRTCELADDELARLDAGERACRCCIRTGTRPTPHRTGSAPSCRCSSRSSAAKRRGCPAGASASGWPRCRRDAAGWCCGCRWPGGAPRRTVGPSDPPDHGSGRRS